MRMPEQIINDMSEHAGFFHRAATALSEPQISERPVEGKWSIKEILCHLVDIQRVCAGRVNKMLSEDNPAIELYYEERENEERDHHDDDMGQYLTAFLLERIALLASLGNKDVMVFERRGQHPIKEDFTIGFVVNDMLDHEQTHFEQIRQLLPQISD